MKQLPGAAEAAAAQSLKTLMGELSDRHFNAAWHTGCEYVLWQAVVEPDSTLVTLNTEDRAELALLSLRAGGWWWWPEEASEQRWAPLIEWRDTYSDWKNGMVRARLRPGAHYILGKVRQMTDESITQEAHCAWVRLENLIVSEFGEPRKE